MTLAYLASPYSHEDFRVRIERFGEAAKACVWLMNHGWNVISPIVQGHVLDMYGQVEGYKAVRLFTYCLIEKSDYHIVLCLPGWENSKGVQDGLKYAEAQHKSILFLLKEVGEGYRLSSRPY